MTKKLTLIGFAIASLTSLVGVPTVSAGAPKPAVATTNVNLRAGTGTNYPVIRVVPKGAGLLTYGCLADYSWCDVSYAGSRGWLAARYIIIGGRPLTRAVAVPAGVPVIYFNRAYWKAHYRAYPWYGRWGYYYGRPPVARPARRAARIGCAVGGCSGSRSFTGPAGRTFSRNFSVGR